jgi:type VI secretion system protein ImpF
MAAAQNRDLLPSFIDRLIDAGRTDASGAVVYTLDQMINTVRADLEELLNTRQSRMMFDCPYPLVKRSILAYGLPDLTSISGAIASDPGAISEHISELIELFEPRLKNVSVHIIRDDNIDDGDVRQLRFDISALLNVDPAPEVGFETIVELSTGQSKVQTTAGLT